MTTKEALKILKVHNEWRRGADIPMPHPTEIGVAIDKAIEVMEDDGQLADLLYKVSGKSILLIHNFKTFDFKSAKLVADELEEILTKKNKS